MRTAIDLARQNKGKLYVAFVDLSNAFPSVDRATLWTKLRSYGISGPMFDCLRAIYPRMQYMVRANGELWEPFQSDMGILAGDPASPLACLLYLADFKPPADPDDVRLLDFLLGHLELADDMALISTTHGGLQRKLNYLARWASINMMESNPRKCNVMIFGGSSANEPPLKLYENDIPFTDSYKYVGVWLSSKGKSLFKLNYEKKAQAGRIAAMAAFSLSSTVGPIDPINGRKIYLAQIDPQLTAASDICLDTELSHLQELQKVQESFIRRFLGIGDKALTAFLFTETGLWPLAYRRLSIAVRFLSYILSLPDSHLARKATIASAHMAELPQPRGWFAGLRRLLKDRAEFHLPTFDNVTAQTVSDAQAAISRALKHSLASKLRDSPKAYLVMEIPCETDKGQICTPVIYLGHYVSVSRPSFTQSRAHQAPTVRSCPGERKDAMDSQTNKTPERT